GRAEIALGSELAAQLGARIGSRVEVVAGPRKKPVEMEVVGRFSTGMYEYDRHLAVAPIPAVQGLIGVQDVVSGIGVKLKDPLQADFLKHKIQAQLGYPYRVISWMDLNANLFAALKLEKAAMFVILTLIVLVACFNIIATLLMLVVQKIKEIGILKALGATSGVVRRIFTLLGLTIGGLGTGLGVGIGLTLCWALERYQFVKLPASVYYIDSLPVRLTASDAGIVVGSALAISWLACLYPAWLAARLTPTEAIRYE
ncbi:MAG: lipoprotein-releasing system transmembrane subunit LolC, partial [Candidatus Omnitrophica bacterium CG11_big_fil_rev_8_21_14_0_20_64_10]